MTIHQQNLPQLQGKLCITDGGMETDLCFNKNIELPEFAAYDLLKTESGYETLYQYYRPYAELASQYQLGLVLETPTWRANQDWGEKIGDSIEDLDQINKRSVQLLSHIKDEYHSANTPIVISGNLGPRGDGYTPDNLMNAAQAEAYHSKQIKSFSETPVDMICALTLNYIDEAIGVAQAAKKYRLPVCISFTVETDGALPTGDSLKKAIEAVDLATDHYPAYYMINCAHTSHFNELLQSNEGWLERVQGVRANASRLSHAELDESETLDDGDPIEFASELTKIKKLSSQFTVLGGCCGTDHRHIHRLCEEISNIA